MGVSYLTPKARPTAVGTLGHGSVAIEPIAAGETIAAFGGRCITRDELELLAEEQQRRSIQIDDTLFLAGALEPEPADFINHSCDPNCGMSGSVLVVALRDIAAGDELTYDFAMSDGSDYDEFECACGVGAVSRQGDRPRLDAARAAAALSRALQPVPQPTHRRPGVGRRRAPRLRPVAHRSHAASYHRPACG